MLRPTLSIVPAVVASPTRRRTALAATMCALASVVAIAATEPAPSASGVASRIAFLRGSEEASEVYVMDADGRGLRGITHNRIWEGAPVWSPDGRRVAFSANGAVYVAAATGTTLRRLTPASVEASSPDWSPDSRTVAFSGKGVASGNGAVYVAAATGTTVRRLTPASVEASSPDWSPDGRRLRITVSARHPGIYVVDEDGTHLRRLTGAECWGASWAPDGRTIATVCDDSIYSIRWDGTQRRRLAAGGSPVWSPDGRRIAFTRDGINVMAADGSHQRKLATTFRSEGHTFAFGGPIWAPDGSTIAFSGDYGTPNHPPQADSVFVVNADGTGRRRLTDDKPYEYSYSPSWSPDGRTLTFCSRRNGQASFDIFTIAKDGTGERRLTRDGIDDMWPTWSPAVR